MGKEKLPTYARLLTRPDEELRQQELKLADEEGQSTFGSAERRRKLRLIRTELFNRANPKPKTEETGAKAAPLKAAA
jgi:hypothetical protein